MIPGFLVLIQHKTDADEKLAFTKAGRSGNAGPSCRVNSAYGSLSRKADEPRKTIARAGTAVTGRGGNGRGRRRSNGASCRTTREPVIKAARAARGAVERRRKEFAEAEGPAVRREDQRKTYGC